MRAMRVIVVVFLVLLTAIPNAYTESVFGGWSVTEERQEIDDSIITIASLYEEDRQAILFVRCWYDEIDVFVKSLVGEFHEQDVEVRIRIDDNPPEDYVWNRSEGRTAAFVLDDEIESLMERVVDLENPNVERRLLIRVPTGNTFSFNMKGFLWAILPVAYACNASF